MAGGTVAHVAFCNMQLVPVAARLGDVLARNMAHLRGRRERGHPMPVHCRMALARAGIIDWMFFVQFGLEN